MIADWAKSVTDFWFALGYERWFSQDPALDFQIQQNCEGLWAQKRSLPATSGLTDAHTALGAAILFDQFPRNMFRGRPEQFATDELALQIAKAAVACGVDKHLSRGERAFLYLPFEHSECLADQKQSLMLFTALGDSRYIRFAQLHHDVIARFGRFPHRNAVLGRAERPDELAAGEVTPW